MNSCGRFTDGTFCVSKYVNVGASTDITKNAFATDLGPTAALLTLLLMPSVAARITRLIIMLFGCGNICAFPCHRLSDLHLCKWHPLSRSPHQDGQTKLDLAVQRHQFKLYESLVTSFLLYGYKAWTLFAGYEKYKGFRLLKQSA